ncbi:tol-pal system-associated acyl-CoA thioesterase [Methylobrevis pamukkalensis]|uniref:Acyl-CoA thioester hydrolase YbgC n=1 Tax=Methylobrevis pamukkalensis TaxID=1439726 RepID=A0A1E3GZ03_9HYPH|nr:tol-pal system-associated acyl-CoA thioesterase [Methylobrevis pamukkalensis]ODN69298.1 Acyl-CoA thioester hydrolase YbgC [Methylobrevis pamukkalensis]
MREAPARPAVHSLPVRVYYEDTDAGGVLYHASHVRFFERGRTEFLRSAGILQSELNAAPAAERVLFVVRRMTIDYLKPAFLDDLLSVETVVREITGTRVSMGQTLLRGDMPLATAEVLVVAIGADLRPVRVPDAIAARLSAPQHGQD